MCCSCGLRRPPPRKSSPCTSAAWNASLLSSSMSKEHRPKQPILLVLSACNNLSDSSFRRVQVPGDMFMIRLHVNQIYLGFMASLQCQAAPLFRAGCSLQIIPQLIVLPSGMHCGIMIRTAQPRVRCLFGIMSRRRQLLTFQWRGARIAFKISYCHLSLVSFPPGFMLERHAS